MSKRFTSSGSGPSSLPVGRGGALAALRDEGLWREQRKAREAVGEKLLRDDEVAEVPQNVVALAAWNGAELVRRETVGEAEQKVANVEQHRGGREEPKGRTAPEARAAPDPSLRRQRRGQRCPHAPEAHAKSPARRIRPGPKKTARGYSCTESRV